MDSSYIFIVVLALALLIWLIYWLPRRQLRLQRGKLAASFNLSVAERMTLEKDLALVENSFRATLAQVIGGFLIFGTIFGTYLTVQVAQRTVEISQKNLELATRGEITDRFIKAIDLLGSEKPDVRLGGIYALERISRDSFDDHWRVMEVLAGFVRGNTDANKPYFRVADVAKPNSISNLAANANSSTAVGADTERLQRPRQDIQTIMTVIGRRNWVGDEPASYVLDLGNTSLAGINLEGANLTRVNLSNANLSGAILRKTVFVDAVLNGANLKGADLYRSDFTAAKLYRALLHDANLTNAKFVRADLTYASFAGADFAGADLSNADIDSALFEDIFGVAKNGKDARNLTMGQFLSCKNWQKAFVSKELDARMQQSR